ncbi:unnamed protein product [Cyprideis torosa]|uniref:Uncharacterized protein n=1 Tax=Cyprideis torosa TaxID=163714 RepID=A0A7R8WG73_9CRUS|nr:unnamed protein product [Cyprideis torosa]CAG0894979.1 unnamed protein product [Cyprideis torosa]
MLALRCLPLFLLAWGTTTYSDSDPSLFDEVPLLLWKPKGKFVNLEEDPFMACQEHGGLPESIFSGIDQEETIVQIIRNTLSLEDFRSSSFSELQSSFESADRRFLPRGRAIEAGLFPDRKQLQGLEGKDVSSKGKKFITVDIGDGGDEEIADVLAVLAKRVKNYIVIFTGRRGSVPRAVASLSRSKRETPVGEPEGRVNSVFSSGCLRIAASDARFHLRKAAGKEIKEGKGYSIELPLDADGDSWSMCDLNAENKTQHKIIWKGMSQGLKTVTLVFDVETTKGNKNWKVSNMRLTYSGDITVPGEAGSIPLQASMQADASGDLQFTMSTEGTAQVYFSLGILTGLFLLVIFLLILLWAFSMMAQLKTNDQFDDPKGKTITVPATVD